MIVGSTTITDNNTAYLWTEAGGMQGLPFCTLGCEQRGYGVSPDGKKILVRHPGPELRRRHARVGSRDRRRRRCSCSPTTPRSSRRRSTLRTTASVLVGFLELEGDDAKHAWIWRSGDAEARFLEDVLAELGLDLDGWQLEAATSISADGHTIAGYGINPNGVREAWVATIPEPATGMLVALGVAFLAAKRRRTGV